jgi:hypothetical protein
LDLDGEPNQRFSSRIAAVIAGAVDRGASPDARVVPMIRKLLGGNPMQVLDPVQQGPVGRPPDPAPER